MENGMGVEGVVVVWEGGWFWEGIEYARDHGAKHRPLSEFLFVLH